MKNADKVIYDLCGGTGAWSKPYADAGYTVIIVTSPDCDVRNYKLPYRAYGIIAAPPCNCFSRVAARWWSRQDAEGKTAGAVEVFRACYRLCLEAQQVSPLENPPGRQLDLMPEIPLPSWQYQPYYIGDNWVKQTYLWGRFNMPFPTEICKPQETIRMPSGHTVGRISRLSGNSPQRGITPPGFAQAFYKANK